MQPVHLNVKMSSAHAKDKHPDSGRRAAAERAVAAILGAELASMERQLGEHVEREHDGWINCFNLVIHFGSLHKLILKPLADDEPEEEGAEDEEEGQGSPPKTSESSTTMHSSGA